MMGRIFNRTARRSAWTVVALGLVFGSVEPLAAANAAPPLLIESVRILDPRSGRVTPTTSLLTVANRVEVAPPEQEIPEATRRIDGQGLIAMPGLVDAHVHYCSEGFGPLLLAHGVTFVRDLGNDANTIHSIRARLNAGELVGPQMMAVGPIVDGSPPIWPFSIPVSDEATALEAVRVVDEGGFDQVKVYSKLSSEQLRLVVDEAHRRGLRAVGHVPPGTSLDEAIEIGIDETQHLYGLGATIAPATDRVEWAAERHAAELWPFWRDYPADRLEAQLERIRASGIAMTPTLVVYESMAASQADYDAGPWANAIPPAMTAWWSRVTDERRASESASMPHRLDAVRRLHAKGVPLMAGSDLCNPRVVPGASLRRELELFVDAGLQPIEAIRTATIVPARHLDRPELGRIADGAAASFVLLRDNPALDLAALGSIEWVVVGGRPFSIRDLDRMIEGVDLAAVGRGGASPEPRDP